MKRSKMLKKIKKVVDEWADCKFEPKMYNEILEVIEESGMLPPLNEDNYHFMDNGDRQIINEAKMFYFTWEKE